MDERDIASEGEANPIVGVVAPLLPASSRGIVEDLAIVYFSANGFPRMSTSSCDNFRKRVSTRLFKKSFEM